MKSGQNNTSDSFVVSYNRVVEQSNVMLDEIAKVVDGLNASLRKDAVEMATPQIPADPLQAANVLASAMGEMTVEVAELARQGRRNRFWIRVASATIAFDLILSGVFFYGLHRTNTTQHRINVLVEQVQRQSATLQDNCLAQNDFNKKNRVLWVGLFTTVQGSKAALPQEVVDAVNKQLDTTFTQTDCAKVGR